MESYRRFKQPKPKPELPISENEVRITTQGSIRKHLNYVTTQLQDKQVGEIVLKAMGQAIIKTVAVAEIIKKRVPMLHQDTAISSVSINDVWEPIEEGLLPVEMTRQVSMISITLSTKKLNTASAGYQAPSPQDQSKPHLKYQQQPRQGRGPDFFFNEDSYGQGRRRGRGGGYNNYQGGYGNCQDNGGYPNWGNWGIGGGRGRSWGNHGTGYERGYPGPSCGCEKGSSGYTRGAGVRDFSNSQVVTVSPQRHSYYSAQRNHSKHCFPYPRPSELQTCSHPSKKNPRTPSSFLVFSVRNSEQQIVYQAPVHRDMAGAAVLVAGPLMRFDLRAGGTGYKIECAGGYFLFSRGSLRISDNLDRLVLYHPVTRSQTCVSSYPHGIPSNLIGVSYFFGFTSEHDYIIYSVEWRRLVEDPLDEETRRRDVTMSVLNLGKDLSNIKNGDWREISWPEAFSEFTHEEKVNALSDCQAVQVDGKLHWWFHHTEYVEFEDYIVEDEENSYAFVVSFDPATERYGLLGEMLPLETLDRRVFSVGGRLAVISLQMNAYLEEVYTLRICVDYAADLWVNQAVITDFLEGDLVWGEGHPNPISSSPFPDCVIVSHALTPARIRVWAYVPATGGEYRIQVVPYDWVPADGDWTGHFTIYQARLEF